MNGQQGSKVSPGFACHNPILPQKVGQQSRLNHLTSKQLVKANIQAQEAQQSQHFHNHFTRILASIKFHLPQVATIIHPSYHPLNIIIREVFTIRKKSLFFFFFFLF